MPRSLISASLTSVAAAVLSLGLSLGLAACSSGARPALVSSASQPQYAVRYADSVASTNKALTDRNAEQKQLSSAFSTRVDELKKPDWDRVESIVEKADASGRSGGFAEAHGDVSTVRTFWSEEGPSISGKVAGGANYAAKEANCTADVGGGAAYALKESMDKHLERRLRAKNEAFLVLERYGTSLGKENTAVLEKLADEVAHASYIVHVDLLEQREKLRARLAEKGTVASTLDDIIRDEHVFQVEPGRTAAEKKASEERITHAQKSRGELDKAAADGDLAMKSIDKDIEAAQKEYAEAIKALKAKIAEKKKTSAAP